MIKLPKGLAGARLLGYKYCAVSVPSVSGTRRPHGGCGCEEIISSPTKLQTLNDFELQQHHRNGFRQYSYWQYRFGLLFRIERRRQRPGRRSRDDIVDLGAGNDSVNFSTDMERFCVYGKGGNDSLGITVSVNTSTLSGGAGNDTLGMTKGVSAYLTGDLGSDTISFVGSDFNNSTVYGGNTSDATSADGADSIAISGTMSASLRSGQRWQ